MFILGHLYKKNELYSLRLIALFKLIGIFVQAIRPVVYCEDNCLYVYVPFIFFDCEQK